MTLTILKLIFCCYFSWVRHLLEDIQIKSCMKQSIYCIFVLFWTNFRHPLVQYHLLAHHLQFFFVIVNYLASLIIMFLKCLWFVSAQNSKLVHKIESLSLNTRLGETTCTLVSWRQGLRHSTRNKCMGRLAHPLHHMCSCVLNQKHVGVKLLIYIWELSLHDLILRHDS